MSDDLVVIGQQFDQDDYYDMKGIRDQYGTNFRILHQDTPATPDCDLTRFNVVLDDFGTVVSFYKG